MITCNMKFITLKITNDLPGPLIPQINIAIQLYLSLITNYHKRQEHICYIRNTSNTLQHSAKTETIDNIAYEIIHRKLNRRLLIYL
jgi:hypothetical protein